MIIVMIVRAVIVVMVVIVLGQCVTGLRWLSVAYHLPILDHAAQELAHRRILLRNRIGYLPRREPFVFLC